MYKNLLQEIIFENFTEGSISLNKFINLSERLDNISDKVVNKIIEQLTPDQIKFKKNLELNAWRKENPKMAKVTGAIGKAGGKMTRFVGRHKVGSSAVAAGVAAGGYLLAKKLKQRKLNQMKLQQQKVA